MGFPIAISRLPTPGPQYGANRNVSPPSLPDPSEGLVCELIIQIEPDLPEPINHGVRLRNHAQAFRRKHKTKRAETGDLQSRCSDCSALASRISGDALTIRLDGTVDFLHQFIGGHLTRWHLRPEQLIEEFRSAHFRDEGTLALRDPTLTIPLNCRRDQHFLGERFGCWREFRQDAFRKIDRQCVHSVHGAHDFLVSANPVLASGHRL